jgi:hypothetical protein
MMDTYISFEDGQIFHCPSLTEISEGRFVMALEEEHTDLGRALVEALWFSHPVRLTWVEENERRDLKAEVYRCHIAGPVFRKKLLEIRAGNPERDMASAWELHIKGQAEKTDLEAAKEAERAAQPEWHLDHPGLHR